MGSTLVAATDSSAARLPTVRAPLRPKAASPVGTLSRTNVLPVLVRKCWETSENTGTVRYGRHVIESMEALERRIEKLRAEVRRAAVSGDGARARVMRAELREAEHAWDEALASLEEQSPPRAAEQLAASPAGPLLPVREQVHQALTLLGAPAAQRLIVTVHDAFFGSQLPSARLTSLRRDEERSFRAAPYSRPYYLCAGTGA
jgi:hypothetical protein